MKIRYRINNITGKNKALCIGDLIRYYGETRYKILEGVQRFNQNDTTKGMVANLLKKATNNPMVDMMLNNIEEFAKKRVFSFTINGNDLLFFDNGVNNCELIIEIGDEYFNAKAIYDLMRPGFRKKLDYNEYIYKEKQDWLNWFEKNLQEYTKDYNKMELKDKVE